MRHHPSELRQFLDGLSLSPKKRLSQNFLIDGNIIRKMATLAQIETGDRVIEIGPGPGALTEVLLEKGVHVTAIEMDSTFASELGRLPKHSGSLEIIAQDFLQVDLNKICQERHVLYKVVANLPYHITTPILAKLLPCYDRFSTLTVMVQKEMAERMLAKPGTKDWNSFSLFLSFYASLSYGFTIQPTCFYPRPKVQSAVIQITLRKPPSISSVERFFQLTRKAFQHRRKMLRVSLKEWYNPLILEAALAKIGVPIDIRPEQLSLEGFMRFFEIIDEKGTHQKP